MNLKNKINEVINHYCDHYSSQDESWLISQFNDISDDAVELECEVNKLRTENARLTEIATEKSTRMNELYESLIDLVTMVEYIQEDIDFLAYKHALEVLNKNNPEGE